MNNIIANQYIAPPPAHAFVVDDVKEGEHEDEVFVPNGLDDEEAAESMIENEEEYKCDVNSEEYQSSGLADDETADDDEICVDDAIKDEEYQSSEHGDEFCEGGINDEEYQSSELVVEDESNKHGRRKVGAFIAICSLVLVCVAAGVGASYNRANVNREGIAAVTENEFESESVSDVASSPPSLCLSKQSFELAMADEVEEYSCNIDKQCDSNDADACYGNTGTICDGACNSLEACVDNQGDIQSCSCLGTDACNINEGDVGLFSCNGKHACKKNKGSIGTLSCNGHNRACFDNNGDVEPESCNGLKACLENHGSIGFKSCNNVKSCHENTGPIGERSCNGEESCLFNTGTIVAKSW